MATLKKSNLYYILIGLLLATSIGCVNCQDDDDEGGGDDEGDEEQVVEKTCQQSIISLVLDAIPILPKCLFSHDNAIKLRLTSIFEALPRIYCVLKCLFAEMTVFGPDGLLDEVSALLFFQEAVPEYALPPIASFNPKEYYCQSYAGFVQCLAGVLVRGIGPFVLECFGTPLFAGIFGILNFVVPPSRSAPPAERRRLTALPGDRRTSVLARFIAMNTKRRQEQNLSINSLPNDPESELNSTFINEILPAITNGSSSKWTSSTSAPLLFMNRSTQKRNNNVYNNIQSNNYNSPKTRRRNDQFNFINTFNANNQYHTNNTNSIVYQLDRLTNLAKNLELLANNTIKLF